MLTKKNHMLYESTTNGFVYCDGISINEIHGFYIDIPDDEICLLDNYGNEIGTINNLKEREFCSFSEINGTCFNDYLIILNGKIKKNITGD